MSDDEQSKAVNEAKTLPPNDPLLQLRGMLKDIFAELGGGEAYLCGERDNFYEPEDTR
ncbi:MAG: hypothetical protein ACRD2S_01490 [Terriglobales bacterium]